MPQSKPPQREQNMIVVANKYVMPGLCPEIAYQFRRRKGLIPHARTIAMNTDVETGAVYPALIHTLFERVETQERKIEQLMRMLTGGPHGGFGVIQGGKVAA
jgi:hypothetical protein